MRKISRKRPLEREETSVLNLKMIDLICKETRRRGLQNEILASHFENAFEFNVYLRIQVLTFAYYQSVTPQESVGQGRLCVNALGMNLFLASRSLTYNISQGCYNFSELYQVFACFSSFLLLCFPFCANQLTNT